MDTRRRIRPGRPGRVGADFRRLPLEQRAVFVLHHYVGLPLVEIADTLGIPAGTARSRLHYATQALRTAMVAETALTTEEARRA